MKRFLEAVWIFIPLAIAAAMYFVLPYFPEVTEYVFSRGIFKAVSVPLGFLSSLIPFSLTELAVVLAVPLVVFLAVLLVVKLRKSSDRKKTALKAGRGVCAALSFACLLYMICHGANFYRLPMEQLMELDTSKKSAEHLLAVCCELAENAAREREGLTLDENGLVTFDVSVMEELTRTNSGYDALVEEYPFLWTSVWRQKPVLLSEPWSYTLIVGMYDPFFVECNINIAQPDFAIPFTAAHESAHSRGIALENECNFLAFLSCINSEYREFRYSGYMEAYKHCSNALYKYDKEMWAQANALLTDGMRADFAAENDYIDRHRGKVEETAGKVNNSFIKVQGVADGELSYSRVTELILAYYEKLWAE